MKSIVTISVLALCLSIFNPIQAQDYKPMVVEGATWIIYYSQEFPESIYYAYRIEGDTTINATDYKKVFLYDLLDDTSGDYRFTDRKLAGILREDRLERKVYGRQYLFPEGSVDIGRCQEIYFNTEDALIVDFSLNIGDLHGHCHLDQSEDTLSRVIEKDTFGFRYGAERRILKSEYGLELIEGIGYEDGLFTGAHTWVHAGKGYGMIDYCIDAEQRCSFSTSINDQVEINNLIYPNPVTDVLNIISDDNIVQLLILNIDGQLLKKHTMTSQIDVSMLAQGVYIISVEFEDGRIGFSKFSIVR